MSRPTKKRKAHPTPELLPISPRSALELLIGRSLSLEEITAIERLAPDIQHAFLRAASDSKA